MMRRIYFSAITFLFAIQAPVSAEGVKHIVDRCTGYIEIVSNSHMEGFRLPSGPSERIAIAPGALVDDFDVSRDGRGRAITIAGYDDFNLLIYSDNNKANTISSKAFIKNPAFSPDGKRIAYLQRNKSDPGNRLQEAWIKDWYLYLIAADGSANRQQSALGFARFKPSWFPDGKRLAISTKDYKIYIIDVETKQETKIVEFGYAPTVSHDGAKILYLSHDIAEPIMKRIIAHLRMKTGEYEKIMSSQSKAKTDLLEIEEYQLKHSLYLYDMATQTSKKITDEVWVEEPALWSPDDSCLIYNDRSYVNNRIFLLDAKTGRREQLQGKEGRIMVWR